MTMSKIVLSGRVSRPPEKRFTPNGNIAVTEFSIAVQSPPRADGTSETSFVKVITWRDLAERCEKEIKKGDLVAVEGRLQIDNYTNQEGQKKRQAEIEAQNVENLSSQISSNQFDEEEAGEVRQPARTGARPAPASKGSNQNNDLDAIFASEDEIPF
jgi:single-strand DNA-binding protein